MASAGHVQVCTSDNHASTSPLSFYRPDALPAAQPTASKHWRQHKNKIKHKTKILGTIIITQVIYQSFADATGSLRMLHDAVWQYRLLYIPNRIFHMEQARNKSYHRLLKRSYILWSTGYSHCMWAWVTFKTFQPSSLHSLFRELDCHCHKCNISVI